ncbi:MAG: N-acetyltransferase [Deltaproteobacteria bacterium]|jgi:predicted N-acyltransferase|nr:N-acetyltransferase [Deltaproteobacteria bacterium]MBW2533661.1 N-acetyltransferase [Deltaproteobacteria bacterium]
MTEGIAAARHGTLAVRTVAGIDSVAAGDWDRCAGGDDPFVSHPFLLALERSGSATAEAGWLPQHLLVEDGRGRLVAAAPLYLKAHSFGEYVFDWGWADAYDRAGVPYYPKLQACVPFTPVTGSRLLAAPGAGANAARRLLVTAIVKLATALELSSAHLTFLTAAEERLCAGLGLLRRRGLQFHWHNRGYQRFDDFLAALLARKRKAVLRERRRAAAAGLTLRTLAGGELRGRHWDALYRFYRNTCDHKWGRAYLTRPFFDELGRRLGDRVVVTMAEDGTTPVAGALHLLGSRTLYGRYWGATTDAQWLHFELCYYRAIELAIDLGLDRVEAGAQGAHKLQRGYTAVPTHSAHWIRHPAFRSAIDRALAEEREEIETELGLLAEQSPYREDRARARGR